MLTEQNELSLAPLPTLKVEDHSLSAIHYWLVNNFESNEKVN
jgi:hypothetical protein